MIETASLMANVSEALASTSLWSAVIRSVAIILLGFFLTKGGVVLCQEKVQVKRGKISFCI